jgi:hypothetical protein
MSPAPVPNKATCWSVGSEVGAPYLDDERLLGSATTSMRVPKARSRSKASDLIVHGARELIRGTYWGKDMGDTQQDPELSLDE